jgi:superfamily II DNA/RNA helicase
MPRINDGRARTSDVDENEPDAAGSNDEAEESYQTTTRGSAPSNFSSLLLREEVVKGLEKEGYTRPSPIQARGIPIGKFGADLIAQAKSGTGKTCMFAVIILESLNLEFRSPQALVVAPTRELAHQTRDVIRSIGAFMQGLGCEAFVGGIATNDDVAMLQGASTCCHVVSGTPGRLRALIEVGALAVEGLRQLVLDEADVLLADAFRPQVDILFQALPQRKQVIAVSATYTPELLNIVRGYMRDPQEVRLVKETASLKGVRQFYQVVGGAVVGTSPHDRQAIITARMQALMDLLETTSFHQCIVFTNSRSVGQRAATLLDKLGFPSRFVCGDQPQRTRLETVSALREFKLRVLVSSDLTSRGIDVDTVNMVVNLELPPSHETYLHRVGRTGRFGTLGVAITLVTAAEEKLVQGMAETLHIEMSPRPDVIPTEWYDYELGDDSEHTKKLNALLETREKQQTDAATAQNLLQQLTMGVAKPQKKSSVHPKMQPTAAQRDSHTGSVHAHYQKPSVMEQHTSRHDTYDFSEHDNARQPNVCDEGDVQKPRGRNLGCLSRGASVQVLRARGNQQVGACVYMYM